MRVWHTHVRMADRNVSVCGTLQDMATEFVNGTLGRVEEIVVDDACPEHVKAIRFRPEGAEHVLTIPRRSLQIAVKGVGMISRSQFPFIPA